MEELLQEALTTIGNENSLFAVVDQGANHFIQKSRILFGDFNDQNWKESLAKRDMANKIMQEAQQAHDDRIQIWAATKQLEAANLQLEATRQASSAPHGLSSDTSEVVTQAISSSAPLITQAVAKGIQQGLSQATSMPFQQPFMPSPITPLDMHQAQVFKHNLFLNDWNALPEFNKNYFFQFPDVFPLFFPNHAQDWYQLSESTRHMVGSNPFQFLATFPPF